MVTQGESPYALACDLAPTSVMEPQRPVLATERAWRERPQAREPNPILREMRAGSN